MHLSELLLWEPPFGFSGFVLQLPFLRNTMVPHDTAIPQNHQAKIAGGGKLRPSFLSYRNLIRPHPPLTRASFAHVLLPSFNDAIVTFERTRITQELEHFKRQSAVKAVHQSPGLIAIDRSRLLVFFRLQVGVIERLVSCLFDHKLYGFVYLVDEQLNYFRTTMK